MENEKKSEIKVFISSRDSTCAKCGENLGRKAWITVDEHKIAFCLACSDMEHLVFLPSGDPALTRRSRKYSALSAVVLKWSRARKRYERQGLLVEEKGLEIAEKECLSDAEFRKSRKEREAERRAGIDREYVKRFMEKIRERFPACPVGVEKEIAEHACLKYSGRVGRSASAKDYSEEAIFLAVQAHVRHAETDYVKLLGKGYSKHNARSIVEDKVLEKLSEWEGISE